MSIHRVKRKQGERFIVRSRDAAGVNTSRAFATREAAERYQREVDAAKAARRERELTEQLGRY